MLARITSAALHLMTSSIGPEPSIETKDAPIPRKFKASEEFVLLISGRLTNMFGSDYDKHNEEKKT